MADELTVQMSMTFTKGGVSETLALASTTYDVAGKRMHKNVQNIGTSEVAVDMGDFAAGSPDDIPGFAFFQNLGPTNYVEIRVGTGIADMVRLNTGEAAAFRLAEDAVAPYAIANTAAVDLLYMIVEK